MAEIRSKEDWIASARQTIPLLKDYAAEFGLPFFPDHALRLLDMGGCRQVLRRLDSLWADLPDHPKIRFPPFFDLCDLCSKGHYVVEDDQLHGDNDNDRD